jgi:hypothetical protein
MVYTFACSVGCFINDDWEIIERVIDFKPLEDKEHEGLYAGKAFAGGARKIGGLNKISFPRVTLGVAYADISTALHQHLHRQRLSK